MAEKRICVVTGASSGIGAQIAADLAAQGNPVLMLARRVEKMKEVVKEKKIPEKLVLLKKCDVTKLKDIETAVAEAEKHFDAKVDLIVNNAGCMYLGHSQVQEEKFYRRMVEVNVIGMMNGIKAVLDGMVKNKRGTIINISSICGRKAFPNHVNYTATKYGVHGMSLTLRQEVFDKNVRVSIVAPGVCSTELLGHNDKGQVDGYKKWTAGLPGRMLIPKDVSSAVLYAYNAPQAVCIREIALAATAQDG